MEFFKLIRNREEPISRSVFDSAVSNPPYQSSYTVEEKITGIQKSPVNVFQHFQYIADDIAQNSSMIYPGGRWASRTGRDMDKFGYYLANSSSLFNVIYFVRTLKIFNGVDVSGGVTIVHKNSKKDNKGQWNLKTFYKDSIMIGQGFCPGDNSVSLYPMVNGLERKVRKYFNNDFVSINHRKLSFSAYDLKSDFALANPDKVVECSHDLSNKPSDAHVRILVNNSAGKAGRATWFWVHRDELSENAMKYVNKWKVIISAKNVNGANGRCMQVEVLPKGTAHSYVRVTIGLFDTENEARNFAKYLATDFSRCLNVASGSLIKNFAQQIPDFNNFVNDSGIDFNVSKDELNDSLCEKFGIDEDLKNDMKIFVDSLARFSEKETFEQ